MNKSFKNILLVSGITATSLFAGSVLASCNAETTYTASSEFYWSSDAGATYGNRTKEYKVGENVYMQLIVKVQSTKSEQEEVGVKLTIPYVKDVASRYMDGQIITPEVDELNHKTMYNFTVISSNQAKDTNFVFRFVPIKATDITLTLTFDDKVSSIYDKQNTITFVNSSETPDESDDSSTTESGTTESSTAE